MKLIIYFNPIIVLFLTFNQEIENFVTLKFQSYYSLIFNLEEHHLIMMIKMHFNPIIVLFLTLKPITLKER